MLSLQGQKIFAAGDPKEILTAQILGEVFNVKADIFTNAAGNEIIFPLAVNRSRD